MYKRILIGAACVMTLFTVGCGKTLSRTGHSKGSVRGAYFEWIENVEKSKGNPEKVVALYSTKAILLPTLSPEMCTSHKMLRKYFYGFLSLKNLQIDTTELVTRKYGDIAMNTGFYTITYTNNGKKEIVRARFDFWYKNVDGHWEIIFHQSSLVPAS
jgi:hypothetical protein